MTWLQMIYIYIYCMYIEPMEDTNTYIHRYTYIPHQSLLDPRHCSIHPYIYIYIYVYISCIYLFYLFIYLFIIYIYITCAKNIHLHIISMYFYGRIKSQKPISQWPLLPGRYFTWAWGLYRTYLDGWIYVYIYVYYVAQASNPPPTPDLMVMVLYVRCM